MNGSSGDRQRERAGWRRSADEYLQSVEIIYIRPCFVESDQVRFRAAFSRDIGEMLPYLNAVISNAIYNHAEGILCYTDNLRMVTLYPQSMTAMKAQNTTDAHQLAADVRALVNDTHRRRAEIEPNFSRRELPSAMDILGWLPEEEYNCGECGETTCLAFASRLYRGEGSVRECLPLLQRRHAEAREALQSMLG